MRSMLAVAVLFSMLAMASMAEDTPTVEALTVRAHKEGKNVFYVFVQEGEASSKDLLDVMANNKQLSKLLAEQFIVGKMEIPANPEDASSELSQKVMSFVKEFGIWGVPSIVMVDGDGKNLAIGSYVKGGVDQLNADITTILRAKAARDELMQQAVAAENPLEKARLLDEAISKIRNFAGIGYEDVIDQIMELDKDNKAGLHAKYLSGKTLRVISEMLSEGKFDEALAKTEAFLKDDKRSGEERQAALFYKGWAMFSTGKDKEAAAVLAEAINVAPNSPGARLMGALLDQITAKIQADE